MRRTAILVALVLVIAACGDDDDATTTAPDATDTATVPATEASESTTPTSVATTTPPAAFDGPTDCLEIWPETAVQAITGADFTFFDGNPDRSACIYTALPNSVALAWRTSDRIGHDQSRSGAGAAGGVVADVDVCDAGYFLELGDGAVIMEGYSEGQGRAYNATVTAIDLELALELGTALIASACSQ